MTSIEHVYAVFCQTRFPLPSEDQVADLERRLGILLPPDYRQYLLEFNGGFFTETEPEIVPPDSDGSLGRLEVMGGIGATHKSGELAVPGRFNPKIFDDNDPPQIMPIGYTLMGHLIFMDTHPEDEDRGWIGLKIAYSDKCHYLADGIEEFFGLLRKPSPDS